MVFSSTLFLFLFLPIVLTAYWLLPTSLRNAWLLAASLFFYAWGETFFVVIMLVSVGVNFAIGLWMDRADTPQHRKLALITAIVANIGLLGAFKYANFVVNNLNVAVELLGLPALHLTKVHLPIGISFFTFQALSYVIDVYRRQTPVQRKPLNLALYISLFPQLIAGPIVRYDAVAGDLDHRKLSTAKISQGIQRFTIGLAKKVLLANTAGMIADRIFALQATELTTGLAWVGVVAYTLQIYFDFSGYSDMAIGLGAMFGFSFPENFNYPYISRSIKDFWRRWHISLSTWFRDYLYIPLGGSRKQPLRTYANLVLVFFLCGLWHGASWSFVIWGFYHGAFLVLERLGLGSRLERAPRAVGHLYTLLVVMVGWVFFRADSATQALQFLRAMCGFSVGIDGQNILWEIGTDSFVLLTLAIGCIGSTPVAARVGKYLLSKERPLFARHAMEAVKMAVLVLLMLAVAMRLASGTHNPFIYYRF